MEELPIIQKTYDLIKWYVPILNKLPRNHRFLLGDRTISLLYDLLEGLIQARYSSHKRSQLEALNSSLDILRYQSRLMLDFHLRDVERSDDVSQQMKAIRSELGGWL
ncbi:MAG: diversity-generating retroelement protein Avd, partial [Pseudanabaena sp.]